MITGFIQVDDGSRYRIAVKNLKGNLYYRAEIRRKFLFFKYWESFSCHFDHGEVYYDSASWWKNIKHAEDNITDHKRLFD